MRFILGIYRRVLAFFFSRKMKGVMPKGTLCITSEFEFEINKGDIVHPCVRYSEKAFKGYHWWLVYTPYYGADAKMENPILCYGISDNNCVPTKWVAYCKVVDMPQNGYNSDPTMFFDEKGLNIYWRESETPRCREDHVVRALYSCVLSENDRYDISHPILSEQNQFTDREVSPGIIKYGEEYLAYAMHLRFKNPKLNFNYPIIGKMGRILFSVLALLEIYNEQKSYGIAVWRSKSHLDSFNYSKTIRIKNCNKLYRPWHLDIFEYENKLYAVIQTNQCNADICLAVSEDYESFTLYSKPLITNMSINKIGIYKPTAFVHNEEFYLYYTAQDLDNRSLNKMYMTSLPMDKLQIELSGS